MAEHDVPTVTVPLEAWRQIVRRTRQLEALRQQQRAIVDSLVRTVDAVPADEAGDQ
jgi:transposase